MKIFDISQEVFSSSVYPGDPAPKKETLLRLSAGDACNLTALSMCAHNGTHIDAPRHFFDEGKAIDELPLDATVGYALVVSHTGDVTEGDAARILKKAREESPDSAARILIRGKATLTLPAAEYLAREGILLFGNESQTVGPENAPAAVHKALLSASVALLEGIRLDGVPDGVYFLVAAPLKLGAADGAPVRALLISE